MRTLIVYLAVAVSLIASEHSLAYAADKTEQNEAIGLLADVTLIDSQCRNLNANFGLAFAYAGARGVHMADVLPFGRRRKDFETAFEQRLATLSQDDLCGSLAQGYNQSFPGLFAAR